MGWIEPIYDRNESDITNKTSKGYLNVDDLNRIEGNISYIAELMAIEVTTKNWTTVSIPTSSDFQRIGNNINTIKSAITFTTYPDYPDLPINHYEKVNTIESMLEAIEGDYMLILGSLLFCGTEGYAGDNLI